MTPRASPVTGTPLVTLDFYLHQFGSVVTRATFRIVALVARARACRRSPLSRAGPSAADLHQLASARRPPASTSSYSGQTPLATYDGDVAAVTPHRPPPRTTASDADRAVVAALRELPARRQQRRAHRTRRPLTVLYSLHHGAQRLRGRAHQRPGQRPCASTPTSSRSRQPQPSTWPGGRIERILAARRATTASGTLSVVLPKPATASSSASWTPASGRRTRLSPAFPPTRRSCTRPTRGSPGPARRVSSGRPVAVQRQGDRGALVLEGLRRVQPLGCRLRLAARRQRPRLAHRRHRGRQPRCRRLRSAIRTSVTCPAWHRPPPSPSTRRAGQPPTRETTAARPPTPSKPSTRPSTTASTSSTTPSPATTRARRRRRAGFPQRRRRRRLRRGCGRRRGADARARSRTRPLGDHGRRQHASARFQGAVVLGNGRRYVGSMVSNRSSATHRSSTPATWPPARRTAERRPCATQARWTRVPVEGAIVVCDRGVTARVTKSQAVAQAGGPRWFCSTTLGSTDADLHTVPSVHVDQARVTPSRPTSRRPTADGLPRCPGCGPDARQPWPTSPPAGPPPSRLATCSSLTSRLLA